MNKDLPEAPSFHFRNPHYFIIMIVMSLSAVHGYCVKNLEYFLIKETEYDQCPEHKQQNLARTGLFV